MFYLSPNLKNMKLLEDDFTQQINEQKSKEGNTAGTFQPSHIVNADISREIFLLSGKDENIVLECIWQKLDLGMSFI